MPDKTQKFMTVQEAGKKGGEKIKAQYGREHFAEMGRKGGSATRAKHGVEFYAEIGRKGGEVTRDTKGPEHYQEIGRKGGQRVKYLVEAAKAAEAKAASVPQPNQEGRKSPPRR